MNQDKEKILAGRPKSTWIDWTSAHVEMWNDWIAERPRVIRDVVAKHHLRMDRLYRLKTTDQHVILHSLSEDGTVSVNVLPEFNRHRPLEIIPKNVFGINPEDLEETDWEGEIQPAPDLDD